VSDCEELVGILEGCLTVKN